MLKEAPSIRATARIDIPSTSIDMICTRFSVASLFMGPTCYREALAASSIAGISRKKLLVLFLVLDVLVREGIILSTEPGEGRAVQAVQTSPPFSKDRRKVR